jgi:gluconokinase
MMKGVAGTGKSTLAKSLSDALDWPYVDGDDLHPRANVEKMSRGEPLDDGDRVPWLMVVRATGVRVLQEREEEERQEGPAAEGLHADGDGRGLVGGGDSARGVILACSALKKSYREILRGMQETGADAVPQGIETYFVWIKGERETLLERIEQRQGHFMKALMLDSQLTALETPEGDDEQDVVVVPLNLSRTDQLGVAINGLRLLIERP